ncbi:pre-toxin TG domain-containing protein, partial [Lysinibacillus xylanilyticus]|uniref:pre-toxin TG domain-containing protein n=1 Tax=Lysinibacillus xylanilyticus TaxID=582475 RepID=UPI003D016176
KKASNATKAAVKQIKKNETAQNLKLVSMGLNHIPVFGNIKSLYEMATGKDMITGQKVENSRARYTNLKNSCPAPKTYSVHDGEPKTTLTDLRKVLSVPSTVNPDGLAPFANMAYAMLFEDIVIYGNPNSTVGERNQALLSILSPFGKAGKAKKGAEAFKDIEKGIEAAHDLANNANKVEKTQHTQKEIEQLGEFSKQLDKGTDKVEINYPLSSTNKKHINKHNIESIKQQSKYLSDSQLADKLESSFFNPNWSKDDINKYAEIAYNDLKSQGKTGNLTYEIGGEIIDVFIHPDGQFGSVYGRHKFTVEDIRKMTK